MVHNLLWFSGSSRIGIKLPLQAHPALENSPCSIWQDTDVQSLQRVSSSECLPTRGASLSGGAPHFETGGRIPGPVFVLFRLLAQLGLKQLRETGMLDDEAALELTVELVTRSVHQVPMNKLRAWLDSAGEDPREAAMKARAAMSRPQLAANWRMRSGSNSPWGRETSVT